MPRSVTELERELNQALEDQKVLEAFDRFYADEVVMQETPVSRAGARQPIDNERLGGPPRSPSFMPRG
jgi:hypothetical protein